MKKKNLLFFMSTFFIVALMVLYALKHADSFKKILEISGFDVGIIFSLHVLMMLVNVYVLDIYVRKLSKPIAFVDLLGTTALNTFFNNVFTRSGFFVKGYLLKKIYSFPVTYFIFATLSFTLIQILGASILGIFCLTVIYFTSGSFYLTIFLFYIFIAVVCIAIINLPYSDSRYKDKNWVISKIGQLVKSWKEMSTDKLFLSKLILFSCLGYIILAARLKYCFDITHAPSNYIQCLLFSSMTVLTSLLSITPEALGIREFLIAMTYDAMKGKMVEAMVATTIDRIIAISSFFVIGVIASIYFVLKYKNILKKTVKTKE